VVVRGRGVCCDGEREGEMGEGDKGCQGGKGESHRYGSLESLFCPRKTPMPSPAPKQTIYSVPDPETRILGNPSSIRTYVPHTTQHSISTG